MLDFIISTIVAIIMLSILCMIGFMNLLRGFVVGMLTWFLTWWAFDHFSTTTVCEELCYGYVPAITGLVVGVGLAIGHRIKEAYND